MVNPLENMIHDLPTGFTKNERILSDEGWLNQLRLGYNLPDGVNNLHGERFSTLT